MWGAEEVVVADELSLRVVRTGPAGPPLLLINGLGASVEMWAPLVATLDGPELVAFDLPGTGSSPRAPRPQRIRGLAHLVVALLDRLGYERIAVLGYSFGGVVAQEIARRAPGRVDRLVLCATGLGLGGIPPDPMAALLMLSPTRYLSKSAAQWMVPRIAGGRTRRDPSSLESQLAERLANPPSKRGYLDQLYAITGWSSLPWLHEIRMPTLILHGDNDPMVPVDNARRMASLMPQANLHIVPGGGHLFMIDEPESVTDELLGFLANG